VPSPKTTLGVGRAMLRMALDHLDVSLPPTYRQDLLGWLGRELRRRHTKLHTQHPSLTPRRQRPRRQGASSGTA